MNFKAMGLAAAIALAAPLSAQAVTHLTPGGSYDVLSDNEFVYDFIGTQSGVVDLDFTFTLTPPPKGRHLFAIQFSGTGAGTSANPVIANPQLNFAATDLVYTAGVGFTGPTISDGVLESIFTSGSPNSRITTFIISASTLLSAGNGLTQVLNLGFLAAPNTQTQISLNVQAVPLPASVLLLLSAVAGLGFVSRRKAA